MPDSRTKGAAFERAVCKRLNTFFVDEGIDLSVKRNLDQYQAKDLCDIELPGFAIECKAYKSGWWHLTAWWDQVCDACGDKTPILIWKFNNKPIRVTLPLHAINNRLPVNNASIAVITFETWLDMLRQDFDFMRATRDIA
jgi:hypothetical protein